MAMAKFYLLAALLAFVELLIDSSQAQYVSFGLCPKLTGIPNFNTSAYQGLWYEVEKYWFAFESTTSCARVTYHNTTGVDGSFPVEILQYDHLTRKTFNNPGLTRWARNNKDGSGDFILELVVTQSPVPFTVKWPYLVLGTDYTSYTIKWSCMQAGPVQLQNIWILSRDKVWKEKTRRQVYALLKKLGIATHALRKSDLRRCPEETETKAGTDTRTEEQDVNKNMV